MIGTCTSTVQSIRFNCWHWVHQEEVLRELKKGVTSLARSKGLSTEDTEDLLQDVIFAIEMGIRDEKFHPAEGNLVAYGMGIAHNKICDIYRARARVYKWIKNSEQGDYDPDQRLPDSSDGPEALVAQEQTREHIEQELARLDPEEKSIVEAIYYKGMDLKQLAKQLGISHANLRQRACRIRKKLRSSLSSPDPA